MIASGNAFRILTSAIPLDFEYLLSDSVLAPIEEIWINFFTPFFFAKMANFSGISVCSFLNVWSPSSFNIPTQLIMISEVLNNDFKLLKLLKDPSINFTWPTLPDVFKKIASFGALVTIFIMYPSLERRFTIYLPKKPVPPKIVTFGDLKESLSSFDF